MIPTLAVRATKVGASDHVAWLRPACPPPPSPALHMLDCETSASCLAGVHAGVFNTFWNQKTVLSFYWPLNATDMGAGGFDLHLTSCMVHALAAPASASDTCHLQ